MKNIYLMLFFALAFAGCKDDINDSSKRNADNCWWVDAKTGKGKWIPIGNQRTVKNGRYTLFYFDGKVYEKGRIVDGENVDTIFACDRNGEPAVYTFPKADTTIHYYLKDGPIQIFNQKGVVLAEGIIQNHRIGDKWKIYYENGKIRLIKNCTHGVGWINEYYESGTIKDSCLYDGQKKLCVEQWFENGKVHIFCEIRGGNFNGAYKRYYSSGGLEFLTQNVDGRVYGAATGWYENGKLKFNGYIKNGQKQGHQIFYYDNGKIKGEGNYENDQPNGDIKFYDLAGKLTAIKTFKKGEEIGKRNLN